MESSQAPAVESLSLGCFITQDEHNPEQQHPDHKKIYSFVQEENKKSSFKLQLGDDDSSSNEISVERPCHVIIQTISSQQPFVLGGFEFWSNSRSIEVYITESNETKETYLTTCRGIKDSSDDDDRHLKALLVIPGGPRSMVRLRLKLLSAQPKGTTQSHIYDMKLKGRLLLPPPPPSQATTRIQQSSAGKQHPTRPSHNNNSNPQPPLMKPSPAFFSSNHKFLPPQPTMPGSPNMSASDISAGLAGISMMVRSTEDRLMGALKAQFLQQQQLLQQQLQQQNGMFLSALQTMQTTQQQLVQKISDLEAQNASLQQLLRVQQEEGIPKSAFLEESPKEESFTSTSDDQILEQQRNRKINGEPANVQQQEVLENGDEEDRKPNAHRSPTAASEIGRNDSFDGDGDPLESITNAENQDAIDTAKLSGDNEDEDNKPPSRLSRADKKVNDVDNDDILEPPDKSYACNNSSDDRSSIEESLENNESKI